MSNAKRLLAAALFTSAGIAMMAGPASAMPVAPGLALQQAAPSQIETVRWGGRHWGWGGVGGGFIAGAIVGGALAAPYYYGPGYYGGGPYYYGGGPYYPAPPAPAYYSGPALAAYVSVNPQPNDAAVTPDTAVVAKVTDGTT